MGVPGYLWGRITSEGFGSQALAITTTSIITYCIGKAIYNSYFHPLSKYPGPKLAASTDFWWAYASTSGRYPWIIEGLLAQYGNVVRIAPNELVFFMPQAARDIYLAQDHNLESFVQVGYDALDTGDGGISGETNPIRHREIARKLAPAFSTRNLKPKEAAVEKHIDLFVQQMDKLGGKKGANLRVWSDWLALDLAADLTYNLDLGQVRKMEDSVLLSATLKLNLFITLSQIARKFRLLSPLIYFAIPPSVWLAMPKLIRMNTDYVRERIKLKGQTEHLDYFEQLVPADKPAPEDKKVLYHLGNVAGQLLLASWQPLANQFYSLMFFLLQEPDAYTTLVQEIRSAFAVRNSITAATEVLANMKYLQACIQESLRLHQDSVDGLPRISPGAVVDGRYIPQGVTCQISYFASSRSPRFFAEPLRFRPERWLSPDHPEYNHKFKDDNLKASRPFSQGPRGCPGGNIASSVLRLFIAKVLWSFDLEIMPGQEGLSFEKGFKFLTFWERPEFWVRFKPVGTV